MSTGGMHNDLRPFSAFTSLQPSYYGLACGSNMAAIFRHSDWLKLWKVATGKPLLCLPCFSIHTGGHVHTHTHIWKSWHYQLCYKNKNVKKMKKMKQTVILSQTVVQTHSQLSTQSQQLHLFLNLKKKMLDIVLHICKTSIWDASKDFPYTINFSPHIKRLFEDHPSKVQHVTHNQT